jgi:hypothetical protein
VTGTRRKTTDAPREDPLSISPFEGDLAEQLEAEPRPRRRPPSVTVLLGAGVLMVGGFIGGVQADRHWGAKPSSDPAALLGQLGRRAGTGTGGIGGGAFGSGATGRPPGGIGTGTGTGTGTGQAGGSGNGTSGTVKLVDGDTIYVQTPSGIVRVKTTKSTKVTVAKKSTARSLKTGSPVVVQGTPGQDGTVTATSVQGG